MTTNKTTEYKTHTSLQPMILHSQPEQSRSKQDPNYNIQMCQEHERHLQVKMNANSENDKHLATCFFRPLLLQYTCTIVVIHSEKDNTSKYEA